MRRLAIFDIDGTLTDSVSLHQSAFIHALQLSGLSGYSTDWATYPHHTDSAIYQAIFEGFHGRPANIADIGAFEALIDVALSDATQGSMVQPVAGAKRFLKHIAHKYDVVFATGSLLRPAMRKLQQAGISVATELITACNEHCSREEIVTEAINLAKRYYKIDEYERIVSFGDGLWDYRTAQNLHIEFIGIRNKELRHEGATVFTDFLYPELYRMLDIYDAFLTEKSIAMRTRPLFTQVRIARPTAQLERVVDFYTGGLGLLQIGSFQNHDGYSGVMLGLPDETVHLEFTQHEQGSPCPAPTKDNLLVLYFPDVDERDKIVARLRDMDYEAAEPENPYWKTHGITIEDPDGWRVVLMKTGRFRND